MSASYALRSSCSKPIVQNSTIPRETRADSSNCEREQGVWPVSRTTLLLWALDRLNCLNRASVWRDALLCVFQATQTQFCDAANLGCGAFCGFFVHLLPHRVSRFGAASLSHPCIYYFSCS